MKLNKFIFLLTALIVLTSGIYRHDQPIERYLALAKESQYNCAGQLLSFDEESWEIAGSFVLIDSNTILSAAHCFVKDLRKDTVIDSQGQKFKTFISKGRVKRKETEFRFLVSNQICEAKSILLHPNYIRDRTCDIAIIKLVKPLSGYKSLLLNTSFDEINDTVTGVGFGVSGPSNKPELVNSYGIKLAGQNIIDSIGGALINGQGTVLFADFDSPDKKVGCNKIGDPRPLELEYSLGGGDSGGPLFSDKTRTIALVGIATYAPKTVANILKNGYYCELNGWTRISVFADWILKNK